MLEILGGQALVDDCVCLGDTLGALDFDLGIIEGMGFPGYFLIVADFIRWAKNNGIPVGPGRGSGAGSLIGALANRTNEENQKLYDRMVDTMLNKLGYCKTCAQKTIEYFCTQEDEN
mgnify:CR=1 FL=1